MKTIQSKAHLYVGIWTPESDSAAFERGEHLRRETLADFLDRISGFTPEFDVKSFRAGGFDGSAGRVATTPTPNSSTTTIF